ncbi:MAG: hypothetical protein H7840_09110 [Alphaproteobacteria bacterium]
MHKMALEGTGRILFLAFLWVALVQAGLALSGLSPVLEGRLVDPDCYMRLDRVLWLHERGDWYDALQPRANAPYGETLHWTRPLDVILLVGAWVGSLVTDFRQALYVWGVLVSPVLLAVAVAVWWWGTRGLLSGRLFLGSVALLSLQLDAFMAFAIGRPDHHSLHALLFIGQLAILQRYFMGSAGVGLVALAGGLCGIGIWVSVEALVPLLFFGVALVGAWLWRGGEGKGAKAVTLYAAGLLLALTAAVAIEYPPSGWMQPHYSRVSVVHWTLAAWGTLAWAGIAWAEMRWGGGRSVWWRFILAAGPGLVLPLAATLVPYPRFIEGPWGDYDYAVVGPWLKTIAEFTPLLPTRRENASLFVLLVGPALVSLPMLIARLRRGEVGERLVMAASAIGIGMFTVLSLVQLRWVGYAQIAALLPWTLTVGWLLRARLRPAVRVLAVLGAVVGPLTLSVALAKPRTVEDVGDVAGGRCRWRGLALHLRDLEPPGTLILSTVYSGPEIMWLTPFRVVGTPYATRESLVDADRFYTSRDDAAALEVVRRRGVDLVAVCAINNENLVFANTDTDTDTGDRETLLERLKTGRPPAWLRPVALPTGLAESHRLYRVE